MVGGVFAMMRTHFEEGNSGGGGNTGVDASERRHYFQLVREEVDEVARLEIRDGDETRVLETLLTSSMDLNRPGVQIALRLIVTGAHSVLVDWRILFGESRR